MGKNLNQMFQDMQRVYDGKILTGLFRGIVENVSDPLGLGRIQVRVYSLFGDVENMPTELLPWATMWSPLRGSFSPPEVNDRVWVMFENGDRMLPIWMGYWNAIPAGRGKSEYNRRKGNEVSSEGWDNVGNYPKSQVLGKSKEGNAIWFNDQEIGNSYWGQINLQDGGGKTIRMDTIDPGSQDYVPGESFHKRYMDAESTSHAMPRGELTLNNIQGSMKMGSDSAGKSYIEQLSKKPANGFIKDAFDVDYTRDYGLANGSPLHKIMSSGGYMMAGGVKDLKSSGKLTFIPQMW